MKRKDIEIPMGVKIISINLEKIISINLEKKYMTVVYEDDTDDRLFDCPETGDTEERPSVGDFCIFWNEANRETACCANFVAIEDGKYKASDKYVYAEAIKFRNYEQYLRVRGLYEDEP